MPTVQVRLRISADELLRYYGGDAKVVRARTIDRQTTVQFPARLLRPFVTEDGVHGIFQLLFTPDNRFREMRQLSENGAVLRRS
jgi:hypothetical protein